MKPVVTPRSRRKAGRPARPTPLYLETLEERCTPTATGFRPVDEVGNNTANPFPRLMQFWRAASAGSMGVEHALSCHPTKDGPP